MNEHVDRPRPLARRRRDRGARPQRWRGLAWRQYRLERKMFWRNPSAAFFNFLLPLLFLGLFGAILSGNKEQLEILVPGIAGMAVMSTTFNALAFNITALREHGDPQARARDAAADLRLPGRDRRQRGHQHRAADPHHHVLRAPAVRARLAAGLARRCGCSSSLGVICFASLGVALSHAIPNFDAAPAYVNAAFLPMIFISGVFYDENVAPTVISDVAQVLPLKHLIDGLQGAIVTRRGRRAPHGRARRARGVGRRRPDARDPRVLVGVALRLGETLAQGARFPIGCSPRGRNPR